MIFAAALLGLLVIFGASGDTVLAKGKPESFSATMIVAVMGFEDVIPAGNSDRVRIAGETLASLALSVSGDARLNNKLVGLVQQSNELFTADPEIDPTARVIDGNSVGTFTITDPFDDGAVVATGKYNLQVSNLAVEESSDFPGGCQIFDEGNWSTTGGDLKGRGTVTACLNFDFVLLTFAGPVIFTGTLN